MTIVIGVDPGKSGGIAAINGQDFVAFDPMPVSSDGLVDCRQLAHWIREISGPDIMNSAIANWTSVWIEDVHAMPGQGVCSMFSFGRSVGAVEGVCEALGLTVKRVRPQVWVRKAEEVLGGHGVDCGKDGKAKAKGSAWAKRLWPDADLRASQRSKKDHDGMGDAVMIAWYGLGFEKSFWKRCGHGEGNGF